MIKVKGKQIWCRIINNNDNDDDDDNGDDDDDDDDDDGSPRQTWSWWSREQWRSPGCCPLPPYQDNDDYNFVNIFADFVIADTSAARALVRPKSAVLLTL